jgi:hypothetical protein
MFTLRNIILFLGIIGLGIVGLVIADQADFINGRQNTQQVIGVGTSATIENPLRLK